MYSWDFSRSDGAVSATTRKTRGLTRSVRALITPPLPAASRPSKTTITRRPLALTHSWSAHNSTCSSRRAFSYSLRFIGSLALGMDRAAMVGNPSGHCNSSIGRRFRGLAVGAPRSRLPEPGEHALRRYTVASARPVLGQLLRSAAADGAPLLRSRPAHRAGDRGGLVARGRYRHRRTLALPRALPRQREHVLPPPPSTDTSWRSWSRASTTRCVRLRPRRWTSRGSHEFLN